MVPPVGLLSSRGYWIPFCVHQLDPCVGEAGGGDGEDWAGTGGAGLVVVLCGGDGTCDGVVGEVVAGTPRAKNLV